MSRRERWRPDARAPAFFVPFSCYPQELTSFSSARPTACPSAAGGRPSRRRRSPAVSSMGSSASTFHRGVLKLQSRDAFGSPTRKTDEYVVDQTVSFGGGGAVTARPRRFESQKDLLGRS